MSKIAVAPCFLLFFLQNEECCIVTLNVITRLDSKKFGNKLQLKAWKCNWTWATKTLDVCIKEISGKGEKKADSSLGWFDIKLSSHSDHKSVSEALSGPQKDKWKQAMIKEYNVMKDKQVWDLVILPEGQKSVNVGV